MENRNDIRNVTVAFDSGVERDTSIRYFVEMALGDNEATVYDGDEEVTNIEEIEVPEAEA